VLTAVSTAELGRRCETGAVADRERASQLGLTAALTSRAGRIDSLSLILRVTVATTISYLLARAFSGSQLPVFAPITTLFVVQASPFSTLGLTAQRVLGTGLGVAAATFYVTWVPVTWWSIFLAILASLLVARALPVGLAGQLQIPVAVVFVLALGPGDPRVDLWRVLDVGLGAVVGVIAVFVLPPRPRLNEARTALTTYAAELTALMRAMADEAGSRGGPLPDDTRHAFIGQSRALRTRAGAVREAVRTAEESVRLNPRARAIGSDLDHLDAQLLWLTRIAIQTRSFAGAVDRVYDRAGEAPALPRTMLATLLTDLASLVDLVMRDGIDDDAHALSDGMSDDVRLAVEVTSGSGDIVEALGSLSLLGRLEQLREIAVGGPRPTDSIDAATHSDEAFEDEPEESSTPAAERIRRLLGRA
jgi:uncharacterized membrane protein YccC